MSPRDDEPTDEELAALLLEHGYVHVDPFEGAAEGMSLRLVKKTRSTVHEVFAFVLPDGEDVWDFVDVFSPDPAFAESQAFSFDADPGPIEYYRRDLDTDLPWGQVARVHLEGRTKTTHRTIIDVPEYSENDVPLPVPDSVTADRYDRTGIFLPGPFSPTGLRGDGYGTLYSGRFLSPKDGGYIESLILGIAESIEDATMQFVHYYHRAGLPLVDRAEIYETQGANLAARAILHDTRLRTTSDVEQVLLERDLLGRDTRA